MTKIELKAALSQSSSLEISASVFLRVAALSLAIHDNARRRQTVADLRRSYLSTTIFLDNHLAIATKSRCHLCFLPAPALIPIHQLTSAEQTLDNAGAVLCSLFFGHENVPLSLSEVLV